MGINPKVAASYREIRRRMLQRIREFRREHYEALQRWKAGDRQATFPAGTCWLRVHHGACCATFDGASRAPP